MMVQDNGLCSFHIIERGSNNKTLLTWSYPSLEDDIRRSILNNIAKFKFAYYFIYSSTKWVYIYEQDTTINGLSSFLVCVIASELVPQRYEKLCIALWNKYNMTRSGPALVKIYLSVYISSYPFKCNGNVPIPDFATCKSYETNVRDVIKHFNHDVVIIYVSLLLKKRIIVFHYDIAIMQQTLLSIIKFGGDNNPKEYLRPFVENLADIKGKMHFVAGSINKEIMNERNYDILIDLSKHQINVLPHVKDHLKLTDFQKKFAKSLCELAYNDDVGEESIIDEIRKKTLQLREELVSLCTVEIASGFRMLTMDHLRSKKFNVNLENFLLNFAIAENMIIL